MRTEDLPPFAPTLMEATRAIGYSLESAIADILDNSIAAGATNIDIDFLPGGDPFIAITDDGTGMSEIELISAMRYGARNPTEERDLGDLGRFGLGLKTASLSQCRRLTVISSKDGSLAGAQWDLDYVNTTGLWSLRVMDEDDCRAIPQSESLKGCSSGTLVLWQNLDRLRAGETDFESVLGKKMDGVRHHLSLVFHRYLAGEKGLRRIGISLNRRELEPLDPFLVNKSTRLMDDETIRVNSHKVAVRPYVLPHLSKLTAKEIESLGGEEGLRRSQGFYVYRNKRLLTWGTWFRLARQGELSKLARVQIDVPNSLDHLWTLDIRKSTAVPPEVVRRRLSEIVEMIAGGSRTTWTTRAKKETTDQIVHIWSRFKNRDGSITYAINRDYPLIKASGEVISRSSLEQLLVQIERHLPINALFDDLTRDEKFTNETEVPETELELILKAVLSVCAGREERLALIQRIPLIEPFDRYPEITSRLLRKEG